MAAMRWWGWGDEGVSFTHEDKPALGPFLERNLDIDVARAVSRPAAFDGLTIPEPSLPKDLAAALDELDVSTDPLDRVVHARGKSLRDLVRHRRGELGRLPDVVVRPADEDEVAAIMRAALDADAVLIPFGGGTSISGSLEAPPSERRTVISLDMARLDRVLAVDAASGLARVQAGAFGPDLERQLNAQGWTLGHFPDSFTHSTLGGWIATRSSGMQSDRYGDIADLTRAVRVVTPAGLLVTRPVPHASTGPSVREMVLGSEGRLGVITEATVQVRRVPGAPGDPRLPVPDLVRRPRGHAGHRRRRDGPVGDARVRRLRDGVLLRDQEGPHGSRPSQVPGADHLPAAPARLRHRRDVPLLHRLRGSAAPGRRPAQGRGADRRSARRTVHRGLARRALRPEEVRHAVHPGLPARPRHRSPTSPRRQRPGAGCPRSTTP